MLHDLLLRPSSCTLVVAPPAWGKTRMLIDFHRMACFKILFISPLRALALELFTALDKEYENIYIIDRLKNRCNVLQRLMARPYGFLITTAEMISDDFLDRLNCGNYLFVFDEFHLLYYWGQSFREHLFEMVMAVANRKHSILGLSATISKTIFEKWKSDFQLGTEEQYYLDLGNQRLKYPPERITHYSKPSQLMRRLHWNLSRKRRNTILLFCAYRNQVDFWSKFYRKHGLVVLGCKGGEVDHFREELLKQRCIDLIVATTALSHGVNLPPIDAVYINYEVNNLDFFIQMVGRGGRKGEKYSLYCRDPFMINNKKRMMQNILNTLFDVLIRVSLYFRLCRPR